MAGMATRPATERANVGTAVVRLTFGRGEERSAGATLLQVRRAMLEAARSAASLPAGVNSLFEGSDSEAWQGWKLAGLTDGGRRQPHSSHIFTWRDGLFLACSSDNLHTQTARTAVQARCKRVAGRLRIFTSSACNAPIHAEDAEAPPLGAQLL
eukprot:365043-Chlamydomonas_euryale.AAC.2